jgi:putative SOS response-associated peptidase YedK
MCGRYRLTAKERFLSELFNLDPEDVDWAARWNIAPTQQVATIRQYRKEPKRKFALMRWGLIPYWSKDASIGVKAINAMSETAAEKPLFREAMRKRRCLIPADSFYEWKQTGMKSKPPYNIGLADDGVFAFAGLWERWKDKAGSVIETCTILTTTANALVQDVHNRMPVILEPDDYDLWLDPGITEPERVTELLRPYDARLMRKYPVSTLVNRVENDGPECAQEVVLSDSESAQGRLFKP